MDVIISNKKEHQSMNEIEKCKCPMCDQEFAPESGLTAKEHLAKGIVRIYREMQDVQHTHELPCPRCGHMIMRPVLEENAFSRYIDVYVCSECGIDEALRDMRKDPLPLNCSRHSEKSTRRPVQKLYP